MEYVLFASLLLMPTGAYTDFRLPERNYAWPMTLDTHSNPNKYTQTDIGSNEILARLFQHTYNRHRRSQEKKIYVDDVRLVRELQNMALNEQKSELELDNKHQKRKLYGAEPNEVQRVPEKKFGLFPCNGWGPNCFNVKVSTFKFLFIINILFLFVGGYKRKAMVVW